MRRVHDLRDHYRRTLATAAALVALAGSACGSPVADTSGPTPSPITAATVRAAFEHSTMKSAHFRFSGTLIKKPGYYPVTGDGILQLVPRDALKMNFRVQTYTSAGVIKIQEVAIGGRLYIRTGSGGWSSKASSGSVTSLTSYVGEETLAGASVWHAQTASKGNIYDLWVRESDGYIVQLTYTSASGNLTMTFDSYNKSPVVAVP
jgi:hypothetical protein